MAAQRNDTAKKTLPSVEAKSFDDLPFNEEEYAAVADAAEVSDISLVKCEFDMQPEYLAEKANAEESGKTLRMGFGASYSSLDYDASVGAVGAVITWELSVKSGRKKILRLRSSYACIYDGLRDKNEAAAKAFLKRVGRFATYPYFRALTSQFSWTSGAELPTLPVLKEGPPIRSVTRPESSVRT